MINLIKADLYKETKKLSFKIISVLIIFVSIFSLIIINKNLNIKNENYEVMPKLSLNDYKNVNKYGNYSQYLKKYNTYEKKLKLINEVKIKNNETKIEKLLSNYDIYFYLIGVFIIFMSFHSFSYDYDKATLKYVFMTKYGRSKVYLSKIFTQLLLAIIYILILILTLLITSCLLTSENIFNVYKTVVINNVYGNIPLITYYFYKGLIYIIPFMFIISFSIFLSILLKGNTFGLVLSNILYLFSLLLSEILFKYGLNIAEYTFLPYLDYTYYNDKITVLTNNMIYNLDLSINNSILYLSIYTLLCVFISVKLLKRDV